MPLDIDFEWQRDEAGYQLVSVGSARNLSPTSPTGTLLRQAGVLSQLISALTDTATQLQTKPLRSEKSSQEKPHELSRVEVALPPHERIVRRGGKLVTYRPFEKVKGLFRVFAGLARTKEGLLDFVQRFGPLTPIGNGIGEDIQIGLVSGQLMNAFLNSSLEERVARLQAMNAGGGLHCGSADISLAVNQATGRPQLKFKVKSLLQALELEFGQHLASGEDVRKCDLCGEWFDAGPSAKRRRGTKFCSDAHRIAFNSQKRTKRSSSGD